MREQIKKCHLDVWSSTISGIDVDKSVSNTHILFVEELAKQKEELVKFYNKQLFKKDELIDSFEEDMEFSSSLLEESLPMLKAYKDIQSNNPLLYQELNTLIFRIEEQIIKNGK
jgi:hypothetical protein